MFTFFYTLGYSIDRNDSPDWKFCWDIDAHARTYGLAQRYNVPILHRYAARKFNDALKKCEKRAWWDECQQDGYFKELLAVIDFVWSMERTKKESLKQIIIQHLCSKSRTKRSPRIRKKYAVILEKLGHSKGVNISKLVEAFDREHQNWMVTRLGEEMQMDRLGDSSDDDE